MDLVISIQRPPTSTLLPYPTLFRSRPVAPVGQGERVLAGQRDPAARALVPLGEPGPLDQPRRGKLGPAGPGRLRSEEHTSELQQPVQFGCRLLLETNNFKLH